MLQNLKQNVASVTKKVLSTVLNIPTVRRHNKEQFKNFVMSPVFEWYFNIMQYVKYKFSFSWKWFKHNGISTKAVQLFKISILYIVINMKNLKTM